MKAVVRQAHVLFVVALHTALSHAVVARQSTEASSFDQVQYLGGMVGFRGTSPRWDNTLTISPEAIAMKSKDSVVLFEISPSQIRSVQYLRYGRDNTLTAFGAIVLWPVGAFSLLVPKTARIGDHFIAIEYFFADCQLGALLLRAHKRNYKDVVTALTLTHKVVEGYGDPGALHTCIKKPD